MQICNSAETSEWEDMSDEEAAPDSEESDSENAVASNSEKQVSSNLEHTGIIVENVN